MNVLLVPGKVTLAELESIWRGGLSVRLDDGARADIDRAAGLVAQAAAGSEAIYGINTGFGKLASMRIKPEDTARLQRNLILSHCCGVGEPLDHETTRLMMVLKLISVGRGASGIRRETVELLEAMLVHNVVPVVPNRGSVGASGDLAPLAHMAAAMIGESEAFLDGERMASGDALRRAGLVPVVLGPKEGLGLINGTQFSNACALSGLFGAKRNLEASVVSSALSTDAIMGSTAPLNPAIHELRGHQGQIDVARAIGVLLMAMTD